MKKEIFGMWLYSHFAAENEPIQWFVSVHRIGKSHHYGPISIHTQNRIYTHCLSWPQSITTDLSNDKTSIAYTIIMNKV